MTLLVHPNTHAQSGIAIDITPESAGWKYVGFRVVKLRTGETYRGDEDGREACIVVVSGCIDAIAGGERYLSLGNRTDLFDGPPTSLYVPAGTGYEITAIVDTELAVCSAPASGAKSVAVIDPSDVRLETRGEGTNRRYVRNILDDRSQIAERLLVVEVITPGGNWSSYPPHKHDTDAAPHETLLEETYYHRLKKPDGFAVQRVYTDDLALDETMLVRDGDAVMVPRGYHPVGAAHGYDLYYLNVMAGPRREWKFTNDPKHEWIIGGEQK